MNVVKMACYRSRHTVEVLEALLVKARDGSITGLALTYQMPQGAEDSVITGSYAASPDTAAASMLRLSMKIANARGEYALAP